MEVKGEPPKSVLIEGSRTKYFFDMEYKPRLKANSKGKTRMPGTRTIVELVGTEDPDFADFLEKCTAWKVSERLSASDSLNHPWVKRAIEELSHK